MITNDKLTNILQYHDKAHNSYLTKAPEKKKKEGILSQHHVNQEEWKAPAATFQRGCGGQSPVNTQGEGGGVLIEHKSHSGPACLSQLTSHNPLVRFDALHTRHWVHKQCESHSDSD